MKDREAIKQIVNALEDKKAHDIRIIDVSRITSLTDYLVIADGNNKNQVQALSDNVQEYMAKYKLPMKNREGYSNAGWILLDYYDIIVHIFSEEERSFYDLEHIWRDGSYISPEDL